MHEWFNLLKHPFRAQYNVRTDSCKQSSRSYANMIRLNVVLKIKLLAQPEVARRMSDKGRLQASERFRAFPKPYGQA